MKFQSIALAVIIFTPLIVTDSVQAQQTRERDLCIENAGQNFGDCLSRSVPEAAVTYPIDKGFGMGGAIVGCTGQYFYRLVQCPSSNSQTSNPSRREAGNSYTPQVENESYSPNPSVWDGGYSHDPYSFDGNGDGVPEQSYDTYSF